MAVATKSKVTTDHEEIRRWAAARSGKPAAAIRSKKADDEDSFLRIHFPNDRRQGSVSEISWDNWFKKFDAAGLALLYQEHTADGEKSTFNKLVSRETVDEVESAVGGKGRSASRRRSRRSEGVGAITTSPTEARSDGTRDANPREAGKKSAKTAGIVTGAKKRHSTRHVSRSGNPEASASHDRPEATANRRHNLLTTQHGGKT